MASPSDSAGERCQPSVCLNQFWQSLTVRPPSRPTVPSLPRTSAARLAQASTADADASSATVLYLAYGSNLSAETFVGNRGIRPLSAINVSAPALDLTFDLPGFPYLEPCFANSAPRKLPKLPIPTPPGAPPIELPPPSDLPSYPGPGGRKGFAAGERYRDDEADEEVAVDGVMKAGAAVRNGPTWIKGLYGVVYEVTREDYATIVRTEGGGASYADVLTLCVELPPAVQIPERPPLPDPPRPFLAHTLFAPRLPDIGEPDRRHADEEEGGDPEKPDPGNPDPGNPGDGKPPKLPQPPPIDDDTKRWWRRWATRLATPAHRPSGDYAQPSLRYLRLIRDGAAEHFLPQDYQTYLSRLEQYTITQRRQRIGRLVFSVLWMPLLLLAIALQKLFADEEGRVPTWLGIAMNVATNIMWLSYDAVFKKLFGDGERTTEEDDGVGSSIVRQQRSENARIKHWWSAGDEAVTGEKNMLLADW